MQTDHNGMHADYAKNESASSTFLKTDGGKTKSNAIEVPTIALPKGGGAIKGIDEKFSVNAVNGTASFSIPLPFAPARGASPALSLSYNSGSGNGIFGLGWNLSLPSIKRKTDKGLPKYFDNIDSDVFLFSEAEDLVPEFKKQLVNGKWVFDFNNGKYEFNERLSLDSMHTIRFYKPRLEGLFARIERWTETATGLIKWRIITKDNTTTLFGWNKDSRITDPSDITGTRIYEWLPEFVFDDKGNCSHYVYEGENLDSLDADSLHDKNRIKNGKLIFTNLYLKKVLYGNSEPYKKFNDPFPVEDKFLFETAFDYGEPGSLADSINAPERRTDAFSDYKAGFEIRTTRLCKRVLLFHVFNELAVRFDKRDKRTLVKSLNFDYDTSSQADFTFLHSITAYGYIKKADGTYSQKNLPPTTFTYQKHEWDKEVKIISTENLIHAPAGLDESQYQFTDLFNEGLSGILTEQAGGWYYKHNLGNGEFENAKLVSPKPSFAGLGSQLHLADLDANGGKQLVNYAAEPKGFFELSDEEEWQPFKNFLSLPNINLSDPNTRMLDLNGDGKAEVLISEDNLFTWYESAGKNGFKESRRTEKSFDEEAGPAIVFADSEQRIFLADMSGDGLSDIVRIRNGEVCYWPNLGYGKFGAKVLMDDSPVFDYPDAYNPSYLRLADIDGSGTTDIIYLGKNKFSCWSNFSGNSFNTFPFEIDAFPDIHNQAKITVTDLLGNGVACIVWSSPLAKDAHAPLRYIDLMSSKKPHIMIGYKNNMGKEVSMEYLPSTHFYLEDKKAGRPWITKLHFPVHCVVKTTVIDHWRKTTFASSYSYHHGFYDHTEREFRGFGRVEQTDVEDFGIFSNGNINSPYITNDHTLYQPPVKTITWYHTGAFLEHNRILNQFQHEYFAPRSTIFSEQSLPEPDLADLNLSAGEYQEALRTCKGMMLRQEVYELDADAVSNNQEIRVKLFSTAFHNCHIQRLQPRGNNLHAIFLVTEKEAITYNYELDLVLQPLQPLKPDPRIAHTLNLSIDAYGNVLESVAIAYPRVGRFTDSSPTLPQGAETLINKVQNELHLVYSQNRYTTLDPATVVTNDQYRLPLPCEVKTFELTNIQKQTQGLYFSLKELQEANISLIPSKEYHLLPDRGIFQKRMVEHVRILYFKNSLQDPLPFGKHNFFGLPYETYKLALTEGLLHDVLGTKLPSLQQTGETYDAILHRILPAGGYHFEDNAWWIRSGIAGFNIDAATHFYLPEKYTDPFGNETNLQFDPYDLFIQKSWDALLNVTDVVSFDYRILAPLEVRDINDNLSEVVFDILGMPAAMAVKGKGNEGDNLNNVSTEIDETLIIPFFTNTGYDEMQSKNFLGNATARYVYYLGETTVSGNITYASHPAAVAAITREKHVTQLKATDENRLQIAFQYADGSGAVIAAKAQAEPETEHGPLRWITNGKTILNNKGKPVKQYEPYFTTSHVYDEPVEVGVTPVMYYDAPGRLMRTEMPDGTINRVEFSPWQVKSFDANDTVLESRWYRERLTAAVRQVLLYAPGVSANEIAEARAAEAIANIAPIEQKDAAKSASIHANTPAQTFLDSLGREVIAVAHNKWQTVINGQATIYEEKYLTYTKLDAEGKPLWIKDARANLVMQYVYPYATDNRTEPDKRTPPSNKYSPCYDIAGNLLFQHSMDAGDKWAINDAAGKPIFAWDVYKPQETTALVENRFYFTQYDKLHRPKGLWLKIDNALPIQIELFKYNDTTMPNGNPNPNLVQLKADNLIGRLKKHYDAGGLVEIKNFDFKGNALEVHRQLLLSKQSTITDWQSNPETKLETVTETYIQITEYDALNRMTRHFNWHKGNGSRVAVYLPEYNRRGILKKEVLVVGAEKINTLPGYRNGTTSDAIADIRYNVKGQREYLKLGNGTITHYEYDEKTFRLQQLRTTRPGSDQEFPTYHSALHDVSVLQQLNYTYDPIGNITDIYDEAFQPSFFNNQQVDPHSQYTYDAMYRLIKAKGRENNNLNQAPDRGRSSDISSVTFPIMDAQAIRNYIQHYQYDAVGNILQMQHIAGNGSFSERWTRHYSYAFEDPSVPASNRLVKTWTGRNPATNSIIYQYDSHGSMLNLANVPDEFRMQWDYRDMIASINLGNGTANYQYDSNKQRTRKYLDYGSNVEERIYLGGLEIYQRTSGGTMIEEIETLHLFDGDQRLLMVDQIITTNNSSLGVGDLHRYTLGNHLGSSTLELDEHAQIISYEEYHPYGTSAYRAGKNAAEMNLKRYRYTGMERDEESGLAYHTARYYLPWLGRWLSADPIGIGDGVNVYLYVQASPLIKADKHGLQTDPPDFPIRRPLFPSDVGRKAHDDILNELKRRLALVGLLAAVEERTQPGGSKPKLDSPMDKEGRTDLIVFEIPFAGIIKGTYNQSTQTVITAHFYELKPIFTGKNDSHKDWFDPKITWERQLQNYLRHDAFDEHSNEIYESQFGTILEKYEALVEMPFRVKIPGGYRWYFTYLPRGVDGRPIPGALEYTFVDLNDNGDDITVVRANSKSDDDDQSGSGENKDNVNQASSKLEPANDNKEPTSEEEEFRPAASDWQTVGQILDVVLTIAEETIAAEVEETIIIGAVGGMLIGG